MKNMLLLLSLLISFQMIGQKELFMPVNFKEAYEKGTRSMDGKPGPNYWQNKANYEITARVTPGTWTIDGTVNVTYYNNSQDTLDELVIRMHPNQYEKGASRDQQILPENLTDGMKFSKVTANGKAFEMDALKSLDRSSTVGDLKLHSPLLPGTSVQLTIDWTSSLPLIYQNRIGAYDDQSAFMGYWYPMVGVYDDIDGWDRSEYRGRQEFYRDFADYKVTIQVPMGYKVYATGTLQNTGEIFTDKGMHQYKKAGMQNIKVNMSDPAYYKTSDEEHWNWTFEAENIMDFAAGISQDFKWETGSVQLGDRRVRSHIIYDKEKSPKKQDLLAAQNKGIKFLSGYLPGFEYPYPQFTSFYGVPEFDGMEFPMIANNGFAFDEIGDPEVIFHELAHTLFPYYMGINEVKYSWMEEGWAIFLTSRFIQDYFKGDPRADHELKRNLKSYNKLAGTQWDPPLFVPSHLMVVDPTQTITAYRKPAFMYFVLEDMLGKPLFKRCLDTYIKRWAGKHPMPYDFTNTFNELSGQNLNWFWDAWLMRYAYPDLKIKHLDDGGVAVKNEGGLPVPIQIDVTYLDGSVKSLRRSAEIWKNGYNEVWLPLENYEQIRSVELTPYPFPDADNSNNKLELSK